MAMTIFKGESKINKIGGKLKSDYQSFRNAVLYVNDNYLPIFQMLGFSLHEDEDLIFKTLMGAEPFMYAVKKAYFAKTERMIDEGELKLETLLSSKVLNREFPIPEQKQKYINSQVHTRLTNRFKDIFNEYISKYKPSYCFNYKTSFRICRESIVTGWHGLEIDVDKFISIYQDYMIAEQSKINIVHQLAADAINRFFNGAVAITQNELARYFTIESGVVVPNPESINMENYMRLGLRNHQVTQKRK